MRVLDIFELLLLSALWGGSFLFLRIAAPVLGPVWLIEARVLLAGLVLLLITARLGLLNEIRSNAKKILIVGCINSAIPFVLFAFASTQLPAGFTSILNSTTPLFGTIVASVWLKEKLTPNAIAGFALGFAGVIILVGWKSFSLTSSFISAVGAAMIASFLYAVAAPYTRKYLQGVTSIALATGSLLSAAIILMPLLPFTVPVQAPTTTVLLAVIALSLLSTAFSYILYFRLINNIGSTKTLTVTYLIPISAMLWGTVVLKEDITPSMVLGCILILLGTTVANDLLIVFTNKNEK
jgi:drug/metabolite transporter (DMT)-like permease